MPFLCCWAINYVVCNYSVLQQFCEEYTLAYLLKKIFETDTKFSGKVKIQCRKEYYTK